VQKTFQAAAAAVSISLLCAAHSAQAATKTVTIDTSSLAGTNADFFWDVIGNGVLPNTVTISGFATDGSWTALPPTGNVTGSLPGTIALSDAGNFFNEQLINVTLGNFLTFKFVPTLNVTVGTPTGFSFGLFDPTTFDPYLADIDPANNQGVLYLLSIYGSPSTEPSGKSSVAELFSSAVTVTPLPAALPLFATGLGAVGLLSWRKKRKVAA